MLSHDAQSHGGKPRCCQPADSCLPPVIVAAPAGPGRAGFFNSWRDRPLLGRCTRRSRVWPSRSFGTRSADRLFCVFQRVRQFSRLRRSWWSPRLAAARGIIQGFAAPPCQRGAVKALRGVSGKTGRSRLRLGAPALSIMAVDFRRQSCYQLCSPRLVLDFLPNHALALGPTDSCRLFLESTRSSRHFHDLIGEKEHSDG